MPITPIGTRTREISSPFGRVQRAITCADRIGKTGDLAQALGHRCDAGLVEREPVDEGGIAALGARGLDILRVGRKDLAGIRLDPLGHGLERSVLRFGGGKRQRGGRLARTPPHIEHHRL